MPFHQRSFQANPDIANTDCVLQCANKYGDYLEQLTFDEVNMLCLLMQHVQVLQWSILSSLPALLISQFQSLPLG